MTGLREPSQSHEATPLERRRFLRRFSRLLRRAESLLQVPPSRHDAHWVHEVRITVRRIEEASGLLPGRLRRGPARDAVRELRRVRKGLAPLRDSQVLMTRLAPFASDPVVRRLLPTLRAQAHSVPRLPAVRPPATVRRLARRTAEAVRTAGIRRRYGRLVERRGRQLQLYIDRVLGGDLGAVTLHTLRTREKRMRYLVEFGSVRGSLPSILPRLEALQQRLGAIHDTDMAIDELRSVAEGTRLAPTLSAISRDRELLTAKLISELRSGWRGPRTGPAFG